MRVSASTGAPQLAASLLATPHKDPFVKPGVVQWSDFTLQQIERFSLHVFPKVEGRVVKNKVRVFVHQAAVDVELIMESKTFALLTPTASSGEQRSGLFPSQSHRLPTFVLTSAPCS